MLSEEQFHELEYDLGLAPGVLTTLNTPCPHRAGADSQASRNSKLISIAEDELIRSLRIGVNLE